MQIKMKSMKSHEERIKKLVAKAKHSAGTQAAGKDAADIDKETKMFTSSWDNLLKM